MTVLRVEQLQATGDGGEVLRSVSIEVAAGEAVGILGANGAGKTTLLRAVCGLLQPTAGRISYAGRPTLGIPTHRLARLGIAYVPSERRLFPGMTVAENLAMGAYPQRPSRTRSREVLDLFPRLAERRAQRAGTLSGGEQQMLAIGRALLSTPTLLLLDEPTTGLAPRLVRETYDALDHLRRAGGLSLVIAEQQVPLVLDVADRTYVLADGRVAIHGTSETLRADPGLRRAYLGPA